MADAQEVELEQFFDSREELSTLLDSCQGVRDPLYLVWVRSPDSIQQRRSEFMKWMSLDHAGKPQPISTDTDNEIVLVDDSAKVDINRLSCDEGAVLRGSDWENDSSASPCSDNVLRLSEDRSCDVQFECRIKNFKDNNTWSRNCDLTLMKRRIGWLRRLGSLACIVDKQGCGIEPGFTDYDQKRNNGFQRIPVRPYRKEYKELSAVYMGQSFVAHHGAILTMKFSPNGEYLASGGEDGVVRVWKVMECQRNKAKDIPGDDSSCIYFSMNNDSKLSALHSDEKKKINSLSLRRTPDSACVVLPQEIFEISEKPLYEFHGHDGDVLDLAWSKDSDLLSASVDKTVRLWKLGCDCSVKIFPHSNYVTSIQFNPIDERYFISGSIDGKARIWEISKCRVVDWADIRQIVTAVCYRPDGKVVVVGSMMGDCRFYDASDNHLQLDAEISFKGGKKSVDRRITGFQFCPGNNLRLMVTSADSTVRILDGMDLVSKYKGLHNCSSQISATYTFDGRHIVSASEDSNVYIWNLSNQQYIPSSKPLKSSWSYERFTSNHVSVAIPWQGFISKIPQLCGDDSKAIPTQECDIKLTKMGYSQSLGSSSAHSHSPSFTLWPELFSEITPPKGSATWPEEKLPSSIPSSCGLRKPQLKLLKASLPKNASHAWGQVIVTAGWDGRIRTFQNYGLPVQL